jgi:chemotaxis family two-component system sensor kinase Cph1
MSENQSRLMQNARAPVLEAPPSPGPGAAVDASACDREPIHIPGCIQPHGFLLALDTTALVAVASDSARSYLDVPLQRIFGRSLFDLLGADSGRKLTDELAAQPIETSARLLGSITIDPSAPSGDAAMPERHRFEVVAYQAIAGNEPLTVLEFEPNRELVDVESINARLFNFVAGIRTLRKVEDICNAAVAEIRTLTGCDRVLLYRFDEAGHGLVLAEERAPGRFASYLGLRFPASDIPAQARRMYELNRLRIIPNVDYEPSILLDANGPASEIDLSRSTLRSVSPVHRQYMRNMGTICSMSVSLIIDERLWGLVSCHHHAPRYVPLRLRSACDFILQVAASQMEAQQNSLRLRRALSARGVQTRLLASMAAQDSYMDGLKKTPELLCELVHADGVAIVQGMSATVFGFTPGESHVMRLVEWLRKSERDELFISHNLPSVYPEGAAFARDASGVIAFAVSRMHNTHVLWFRRELVQTVRWAGNPEKPVEPNSDGSPAVNPRHSFDEWSQIVRGCSERWSTVDVEAAGELRSSILEIVLQRAEELAVLASGLQVANEELEAFSYSVSHDLRAPFRHISGFSEMLKETEGSRMSERGQSYLATIMESARFAGTLVDSLLDFSRFARTSITLSSVDLEPLVDREWQAVLADEAHGRAIDFSRTALPRVNGDPQLLRQVLRNLFSNAVKYTGKCADARVRMEARIEGQECIFSVADNGVGFDQQYAGKLFGVFQRLHRIEDFEGTGIGLANVRRIIGRHGGRTWAEGAVGQGATIFFTMPASFGAENA